jgi:hypothetical protein
MNEDCTRAEGYPGCCIYPRFAEAADEGWYGDNHCQTHDRCDDHGSMGVHSRGTRSTISKILSGAFPTLAQARS